MNDSDSWRFPARGLRRANSKKIMRRDQAREIAKPKILKPEPIKPDFMKNRYILAESPTKNTDEAAEPKPRAGAPNYVPAAPNRSVKAPRLFGDFAGTSDRKSLGVACCRFNGTRPEILLVCKRYTYAYSMFVHGKYNSNDSAALIVLFSGMTVDEKHDLLSLNFMQIWYRVWLRSTQKTANYFVAKNKFESTFVVDGGARLRKMISKSAHSNRLWEIPKGRKRNRSEADIHCAVREFHEETGLSKKNYKLFPEAIRSYSYVDAGTRYTNIYYLAFTKYNIEPRIDFSSPEQADEISDIRWMDIEDIRRADESRRLEKFVRPIFNFMKKYAR